MCGIAGEYLFNNEYSDDTISLSQLEQVNLKQQVRGPDSSGVYHLGNLALLHRRLKIFDLTDRAAQPMVDHVLGLAMVFNGAIYNFLELRKELENKGYKFISDSDTEVLLKAYHAWGDNCVERLRGMFAFAIWERETGKLVLARDRMGIKPLYYANSTNGFKFASTLPALLEFEGIDKSIDKTALHYYLAFHAVPEPLTILSGVRKLPPANIMTVHANGKIEQKPYWKLEFNEGKTNNKQSEKTWLEATQAALSLATNRQLAADVPVGVLLSGGLDSSLLVALAAQKREQNLETFSIGFESVNGEQGDEFYYSDIVAKHFNTKHHQMFIPNQKLVDSLGDCIKSMSEPMISHDNIGFYLLSQEVAKHVKVVLSGQGADELFTGYHWFQNLPIEQIDAQESAKLILNLVADRSYNEYAKLVTAEYKTTNQALGFLNAMCENNSSKNIADNLQIYEAGFALANGPLPRVDNMTMAASLEARVPFLDEEVVSLATTMPLQYKLPDNGKYIVKKLARKLLPIEVVDRKKGYFPVPALKYLHGSTLELMHEVLSKQNVKERGIFDFKSIEIMFANPNTYITNLGNSQLWQIGLLEYWLKQHNL